MNTTNSAAPSRARRTAVLLTLIFAWAPVAFPAETAVPLATIPGVATNYVLVTNVIVVTNYVITSKVVLSTNALALGRTNSSLPSLSWVPPEDGFDWIQLKSGEWLKGSIKAMQERKLDFDSEELKLMTFDWKDIRQVRSSHLNELLFEKHGKFTGSIMITPDQVTVGGAEPHTFARSELQSIAPGGSKERNYWSGKVSLGLTLHSGNSSSMDYNGQASLQRRTPATRLKLDYIGNVSSVDQVESANNHRVNTEFDYWFSRRFYLILPQAEYFKDPFQNIDNRLTIGGGAGYDILDRRGLEWNVSVGPAYQQTWFKSVQPGEPTTRGQAALTFGTKFDWEITRRIEMILDYRGQYTSRQVGETFHHFVTTLSLELTKRFDLDASFVWDRTQNPKPDITGLVPKQDDFRLVLGLGVRFYHALPMKTRQALRSRAATTRSVVSMAISLFFPWLLQAADTNSQPPSPSIRNFSIPDLNDVTVKGVRISPGASSHSEVGGQGSVSLDAPGSSFSASVPLPAGGTSSNKAEFVAAPIPFFSPSIGFGIGLGAAYIYNPPAAGTNTPPWVTGVGGFYSDNGSWGAGAAHKMNWNEDRWRLLAVAAYADFRYDFFGVGAGAGEAGRSVPLQQTMAGGLVELLRGVGQGWYVGGRYQLATVKTSVDGSDLSIPPSLAGIPLALRAQLSAFGIRLQRDTRDSSFYPTRGTLFDFNADFFDPSIGSDFTFQTYALSYNRYFALATNHVLALRGYGRATSGDTPFFALSSFGTGADLRGYTPGRYRDNLMFALQAEYRWRLTERLGLVTFGGVGGVAPELGKFDKILPGGGIGARYVLAKKNNVSLRFDVAWGRDEHTFYVGIGEAF